MSRTEITGKQIRDATIQRPDLDVTTTGQALLTKVIAGTLISLSSTGVDAGTGDVTINVTSPIPVANGGTGQTTLQAAINALTQVSSATNEFVLTKDTATGNAIWKAATGGSGITTLNTLTASTQTFAVGSAGTDFAISSSSSTHTFNIPNASASNRGLVTTAAQTIAGLKTLSAGLTVGNNIQSNNAGLINLGDSNNPWNSVFTRNLKSATGEDLNLEIPAGGARQLKFAVNGTTQWYINSSGNFVPQTNAGPSIGALGTGLSNVYTNNLRSNTTSDALAFGIGSTAQMTLRTDGYLEFVHATNSQGLYKASGSALIVRNNSTTGGVTLVSNYVFGTSGGTIELFTGSAGLNIVSQQHIRVYTGGVLRTTTDGSGHFYPNSDNGQLCGANGARWSAVWAATGTIQTSDGREKHTITTSVLGLDFINSLRPVSYKWTVGRNIVTGNGADKDGNILPPTITPIPGSRTHWGLIAQEVKVAVDNAGVDFGGWILTDSEDENSQQGLRYDQFIAPIIKAIQELKADNDVKQTIIDELIERVEVLENA